MNILEKFTEQVQKSLEERSIGYAQGISIECPKCKGKAYYQYHKFQGLIKGECFQGCFNGSFLNDQKQDKLPEFKRGEKKKKQIKGFF